MGECIKGLLVRSLQSVSRDMVVIMMVHLRLLVQLALVHTDMSSLWQVDMTRLMEVGVTRVGQVDMTRLFGIDVTSVGLVSMTRLW